MWTQSTSTGGAARFVTPEQANLERLVAEAQRGINADAATRAAATDAENQAFLEHVADEHEAYNRSPAPAQPKQRAGLFSALAMMGALALGGLSFLHGARAQNVHALGAPPAFRYYVPTVAHLNGANNSVWRSALRGQNLGSDVADLTYILHPRGVPGTSSDPQGVTQINAWNTFSLDDPVGRLNVDGAGWLEITSTQPLAFSASYAYNLAPDGTQQGQDFPVFDASQLETDNRLLKPGDNVRFTIPDLSTKRVNYAVFILPGTRNTVGVRNQLYDNQGRIVTTSGANFTKGTLFQWSPIDASMNQTQVAAGDAFKVTIGEEGDVGTAYVYACLDVVDNLLQTKQDPYTDTGTITPAFTSIEYRILPDQAEENDTIIYRIAAKSRSGVDVAEIGTDELGSGAFSRDFKNTTGPLIIQYAENAQGTGTWTPRMRVYAKDEDGYSFSRDITGNTWTVTAASVYTVPLNVAAPIIRANLDYLANQLSYGLYDGTCLSATDARAALDYYTDGNLSNGEARDGFKIDKQSQAFQMLNVNGAGNNKTVGHLPSSAMQYIATILPKPQ